MDSKFYTVRVSRDGTTWLADVTGAPGGVHDFAPTLAILDRRVREAIALLEDLPAAAEPMLHLVYQYHLGDDRLDQLTSRLRADRQRIEQEARELAEQTAQVASRLVRDAVMAPGDAAILLGITPQRVTRILSTSKAERRG